MGDTETVTREVPTPAETVTETVTETDEAGGAALEEAQATIAEQETVIAELRDTNLAQAEASPSEAAAASPAPEPEPAPAASTVTEGVYIVGEDVQPGTYRTDNSNGSFCSMWQYPDLSRDVSNVLEYVQGEGPLILPVQTLGSVIEVAGPCEWSVSG